MSSGSVPWAEHCALGLLEAVVAVQVASSRSLLLVLLIATEGPRPQGGDLEHMPATQFSHTRLVNRTVSGQVRLEGPLNPTQAKPRHSDVLKLSFSLV